MLDDNKNKTINRRSILGGAGGIAAASILRDFGGVSADDKAPALFTHGVASGDPLTDRVIIWTRAVPNGSSSKNIPVAWEICNDDTFQNILLRGHTTTGPKSDYTVKVDVVGLKPGQTYYYRFICEDVISPLGRTKTLPAGRVDALDLAVVSCSNYPQGYFHVYKEIANRDFDAVLHLGDYIYEYPAGGYSNEKMVNEHGRAVAPKGEVIALDDYRTRYGLYRSDPDLQAVHAAHPFICVWDDHEVANDTWKTGAQNHNEGEGLFADRKKAALRAYHEWLPIRESQTGQENIYRAFQVGDLATLVMLDTRITGRTKGLEYAEDLPPRTMAFNMAATPPKAITDSAELEKLKADQKLAGNIKEIPIPFKFENGRSTPILDWNIIKTLNPEKLPEGITYLPDTERFKNEILGGKDRTLLGETQEKWLETVLAKSKSAGTPWQIIGQQVLTGKVGFPNIADEHIDYEKASYVTPEQIARFRMLSQLGMPLNLDAWDGYPAARNRLFSTLKTNAVNAVTLAGDTHNAWAFDMKDEAGNAVAVEFATAGVSSPGLESYLPVDPNVTEKALKDASPELKYINAQNRGWLELAITKANVTATWQYVSTVHEREYTLLDAVSLKTKAGRHVIE